MAFLQLLASLGVLGTLTTCEARQLLQNADVARLGADCWIQCGNQSGHCSWCGQDNFCCRRDDEADEVECKRADPQSIDRHQCVAAPEFGPTKEEINLYAKVMKVNPMPKGPPSMSVYVFSRIDAHLRRAQIRDMWMRASKRHDIRLSYKFAVCGGQGNTINANQGASLLGDEGDADVELPNLDASVRSTLQEELTLFDDVVYLDCEEGYGEGALTRKVLTCMEHFWNYQKSDYFMKIDDDTFIAWSRYAPRLLSAGHHYVYMGIPIGEGVPCRRKDFRWYEPYFTFNKALFPKGMSGGSGYTLGQALVDLVLHADIGKQNVLYNEDRAVGVWMDKIQRSGIKVDYTGVRGVDGFWAWNWRKPTQNWHVWGGYPYVLHHGLDGDTIHCLSEADDKGVKSKKIDVCFQPEVGKKYEPLRCAEMNKEAKALQKKTAKTV